MAAFYIRVEEINGLRMITGCTASKEYAAQNWGLGKYSKVLADCEHDVKAESVRQGLTDVTNKPVLTTNYEPKGDKS